MFDERFGGAGRGPNDDRVAWLMLVAVAAIALAGFVIHRLVFGAG